MTGRNKRIVERSFLRAVHLARNGDDLGAMEVVVAALSARDGADPMHAQLERLLALARADLSVGAGEGEAPEFAAPASGMLAALTAWAEGLWADDARIESLRAAAAADRSVPLLAVALTAWARRAAAGGRVFAAAPACREAAVLLRVASAQDPRYQYRLADCLKLLGAVEASVGNTAEAAKAAAEACRVFRALSEGEPGLLPQLASALHNMAGVRLRCGDPGGAVSAARQAVDLRRELAGSEMFRADLAESLAQSSLVLHAAGLAAEARSACAEAAAIYRQLAAEVGGQFNPDLASALRLCSQQALAEDRWEEGLAALEEEIALYRSEPDAQAAARPLAEALHNQAGLLRLLGDDARALVSVQQGLAIRRSLPRRAPAKDRADLAASLALAGALAVRIGLLNEAAAAFEEAAALLQGLRNGLDMEIELALGRASVEAAALRGGAGDLAAAAAATHVAAGAFANVARVAPEAAAALARALLQSGNLHRRAGAADKAIEAYAAAAGLRDALSKAGGDDLIAIAAGHKLVICLKRAGRAAEAQGWARRLGIGRIN